jgi:hypothetical protein
LVIGLSLCGSAVACGDDDESHYQCCTAQALCKECGCGPNQSIADSGDELRCVKFLNEGDWECAGYTEIDARNSCRGK